MSLRAKIWRLRGEIYDCRVELRRAIHQAQVWRRLRNREWILRRAAHVEAQNEFDKVIEAPNEFDTTENMHCREAEYEEEVEYLADARHKQYVRNRRERLLRRRTIQDSSDSDTVHSSRSNESTNQECKDDIIEWSANEEGDDRDDNPDADETESDNDSRNESESESVSDGSGSDTGGGSDTDSNSESDSSGTDNE